MQPNTTVGLNRTGYQMSPFDTGDMIKAAEELTPNIASDGSELDTERGRFIGMAGEIGSVPIPSSIKGATTMAMSKLSGESPAVLIDKLGERLAFERAGTRLYDALMPKMLAAVDNGMDKHLGPVCTVEDGTTETPTITLARIRAEELMHFRMLSDCIESLGADPTAQTPCADTGAVASMGLIQVITDPRTSLAQCLEAVLIGELTDNAGWEMLIELAENHGQDEFAQRFRPALEQEREHLRVVRGWLNNLVLSGA